MRRQVWIDLRRLDEAEAKRFKGARWALLKNPTDLNDGQAPPCEGSAAAAGTCGGPTP